MLLFPGMREDICRRESMADTFERCKAQECLEKEEKSGDPGTGPRKSIDELVTRIDSFAINSQIFIFAFISSD